MRDRGCTTNRDWVRAVEQPFTDRFGEAAMDASEGRIDAMMDMGDIVTDDAGVAVALSDAVCAGGQGRLATLNPRWWRWPRRIAR